uniref:non-specific serine/threonine protein kinase n=1 Tax=Meloidogyne enterolobii TaxID=390850 RepID=A0A6V7WQW9_MELEN|nr:unnamed protein product [Meloidogyne enterolobii]
MFDIQFGDSQQQQFGCTNMSTISSSATGESSCSAASVMIAKRERRLRLEKVGSYRVGRILGRGNFAQVRVAYHEIANAKVAMKIVDKRSLDAENLAKIEREIQILQKLNHPFIVKLYEVIRTNRFLYIVTEYVSNGELFDMLMDGGRQTEVESRRIFQQIVSAVVYCHASGIVHRDLKAENLLLDKKGNIKIIDFGFSNYQQPSQLLSTWCGSPPYAAPELLLAQEYDGRLSDVWSLGVILYILVTAGFPFPGDSVEKLKRAVLSDHLKIPFWVSVECADLIRKMLTISPAKRYNLQQVIQHRWFSAGKMPEQIKMLLITSVNKEQLAISTDETINVPPTIRPILDPTVLVFMQQHTGWSDDQISEEVISHNYESPIFATYELLLARLSEFRSAEAAAALSTNTGGFSGVGTNFAFMENEHTRRGSRGSIISGKANITPTETTQCATIPTHHLAKLSLSTSPDYDSDDSDSANDLVDSMSNDDITSLSSSIPFIQSQQQQQRSPNVYKSRRRAYRRNQATNEQHQLIEQQQFQQRQRFPYALEYHQLNPLLNAVAQQFAVDTTRAWANAAAAAALFASQIQQQNSSGGSSSGTAALQQAAALNLVSLQNFPFVDYARMIHVPNQERRASANEALLGLNSYAHLLASTMGVGSGGGNGSGGPDTRCSSSQGTSSSPRQLQTQPPHRSSCHQQPRRSVEEEGESYLLGQRGANKRNTVHSITGGLPIFAGGSGSGSSGVPGTSFQHRHSRTMPYFKQILGDERRSSWASSCSSSITSGSVAAATAAALAINAQQQAQLERLYRQSIAQTNAAASTSDATASSALPSVQQLQLEFQKLYASTKEGSPGPAASSAAVSAQNPLLMGGLMNVDPGALFIKSALAQLQQQQQMPTINITDENNQNVESAFLSLESNSILPNTDPPTLPNVYSATGGIGNSLSLTNSPTDIGTNQQLKFVYIPVCIETATQRLEKYVKNNQLLCEVQCDEQKEASTQIVNSVRIRVAPSSNGSNKTTILELILYRIDQSPNISRAAFTHIQGDVNEYEQLRVNLLSIFNEVV